MTALSRHKIQGKLCERLHSPSNIQSFYLFWVKGDGMSGVSQGVKLDVWRVRGGQGGDQRSPIGSTARVDALSDNL